MSILIQTSIKGLSHQAWKAQDIVSKRGRLLQYFASSFLNATASTLIVEVLTPAVLEGDYDTWKEAHIRDYQKIYRKVELYLGPQKKEATDARLRNLKSGGEDNGLFALYFQYGRYLMIAASRAGSLPANLQGIWSWKFQAPWSCNWSAHFVAASAEERWRIYWMELCMDHQPYGSAGRRRRHLGISAYPFDEIYLS